jgi:hypothetical protein
MGKWSFQLAIRGNKTLEREILRRAKLEPRTRRSAPGNGPTELRLGAHLIGEVRSCLKATRFLRNWFLSFSYKRLAS